VTIFGVCVLVKDCTTAVTAFREGQRLSVSSVTSTVCSFHNYSNNNFH